jgi:O-antigen ligase
MILLWIMIFLIPFQNHPLLSASIGPKFTPIKAVGILALGLGLAALLSPPKGIPRPRLLPEGWLFLLFAGSQFLLAAVWYPTTGDDAMRSLFSFVVFLVAVLGLVKDAADLRRVFWACLISMAWSSTYMFKEYFTLRHVFSGFRPRGSFGDSNYFCIASTIAIPMGIALVQTCRGWRRWLAAALVGAVVGGVMVAQSRGGVLGLLVVGLLLVLSSARPVRSGILLVACLGVAAPLMPANFWERMKKTEIKEDTKVAGDDLSNRRRIELPRSGVLMWQENRILGVGPGNYKENSAVYNPILWELNGPGIAHNTFVEILAEHGLWGVGCFLGIFLLTVRTCNRAIRLHADLPDLVASARALKIGLYGFASSAVFLSAQFSKFYWLALFLAHAVDRISRSETERTLSPLGGSIRETRP